MSILNVNTIKPVGSGTTITVQGSFNLQNALKVGGDSQTLDTYGIIKTNRTTLSESVTIPSGTNGMTAGPLTIADGVAVTVNGAWTIV
jgi:hypothetical protein